MQAATIMLIYFLISGKANSEAPPSKLENFINLTHQFYNEKQINVLTIFSCFNLDENVKIHKRLSAGHFQVQIISQQVDDWQYPGYLRIGVVADMDCKVVDLFLYNSRERYYFNNNFIWLFCDMDGRRDETELIDYFRGLDVLPISEATVLNLKNLRWYDVYKVSTDRDPILTEIYVDNSTKYDIRFALKEFGTVGSRRQNLQNICLTAGTVVSMPDVFTSVDDVSMRYIDSFIRSNYPVFTYLMANLNFSINLRQVDRFGWVRPDGSFDGLTALFERGVIEIGALGIFMRLDRAPYILFAAETFHIKSTVIFRQPPLSSVANIFILPFNTSVWIACVMLTAIVIIAFLFQWKLKMVREKLHPLEAVTFVLGVNFQQGLTVPLKTLSGRMLVFITFISSIALFTAYAANIVSLLQSPSNAIKSFEDLASSSLRVIVQDTVYNPIFYNETNDPSKIQLFKKKIEPYGRAAFDTELSGMNKMRSGAYAFQVEENAAYTIISNTFEEHEKCGLKQLPGFKLPKLAIPLRKHSLYREIIAQRVILMREVGILRREEIIWYAQKYKCPGRGGTFKSVGFIECRPAFFALAVGIVLSVLIFIIELVMKYVQLCLEPSDEVMEFVN